MIKITNLKAGIEDTLILNGINLEVKAGEVHAIMGPNGSGKSTLASVIAGKEDYEVTEGEIDFEGDDLLDLPPEERANKGVFLSFQYPVEIPGISVSNSTVSSPSSILALTTLICSPTLKSRLKDLPLIPLWTNFLSSLDWLPAMSRTSS